MTLAFHPQLPGDVRLRNNLGELVLSCDQIRSLTLPLAKSSSVRCSASFDSFNNNHRSARDRALLEKIELQSGTFATHYLTSMSSANVSSSYPYAARQVAIYAGLPTLVGGLVGELLNIAVFLSLKTFRENSCAFYLTVMSFVNVGQLLTSLLFQIMIRGFSIDWTETCPFYCKFRMFVLQFCTLMSCTCMCLATIDQYLATCYTRFWQQLSNIRLARALTLIYFVVWAIHGIPFLVYFEVVDSPTTNSTFCNIISSAFLMYFHYSFIITLAGFFPIFVTVFFGFLALHNVQNLMYRTVPLVRRELDRQLTVMVLVEVVFNCVTTLPYIVLYTIMRDSNVTKDPHVYARFQLLAAIFFNMYFLHYAVSRIEGDGSNAVVLVVADAVLHLLLCLRTISSAVDLRALRNAFQSLATADARGQSSLATAFE